MIEAASVLAAESSTGGFIYTIILLSFPSFKFLLVYIR